MVAAAIIGAGVISAGASAYGSSQQSGAASNANALQNAQYQQSRADLAPWRAAGTNALSQLQYSLGIGPAPGTPVAAGNDNSMTPGMMAAQQAGPHSQSGIPGGNGYAAPFDIIGGSLFGKKNASPIQDIAGALAAGHPVSDSDWAKAGYGPGGSLTAGQVDPFTGKPYQPPPTLAQANPTTPGHDATQTSPYGAFQASPGYQFQFDQGLRAVDQGAASRGMLKSGAAIKDEMRFGQGTADQEYGSWLNRLQAVAGLGQTATNTGIAAGQNYADNASSLGLYGAASRASGYSGIANAFGGTVNNLAQLGYFNGGASNGYANYANGTWTPGAQGFPG